MIMCLWGFYFELVFVIKLLSKKSTMTGDKLEESIKWECAVNFAPSSLLCCLDYPISNHYWDILVDRATPLKAFVSTTQRIERQLQR